MRTPSLWAMLLWGAVGLAAAPAFSQDAGRTLAEELEGLPPGPRIAYLKHLIAEGKGGAETHFQLGVAFHEDGKSDSAAVHYAKAAELDTTLSKAYVNWGVVLDEQGRSPEALVLFERAVAANPRDLLAHAHASYVLFGRGEYEPAHEHLARAFAIDSLHPQPHFYLAVFFWESAMYREALREWERVVSLAPGSYLAGKAEENMKILLQAMGGEMGEGVPPPRR